MSNWKDHLDPAARGGRYLPWKEVARATGLSRTTAWRLQRRGEFPSPYAISPGRVGFREDEIEAWRASRDHSLPRPERVSPPSQARDRAPDAIKRTNEMKAAAAAESASGQASPQPSCPGEKLQVAAARPPVRRRSQHAQAIAQQMLLDF